MKKWFRIEGLIKRMGFSQKARVLQIVLQVFFFRKACFHEYWNTFFSFFV